MTERNMDHVVDPSELDSEYEESGTGLMGPGTPSLSAGGRMYDNLMGEVGDPAEEFEDGTPSDAQEPQEEEQDPEWAYVADNMVPAEIHEANARLYELRPELANPRVQEAMRETLADIEQAYGRFVAQHPETLQRVYDELGLEEHFNSPTGGGVDERGNVHKQWASPIEHDQTVSGLLREHSTERLERLQKNTAGIGD